MVAHPRRGEGGVAMRDQLPYVACLEYNGVSLFAGRTMSTVELRNQAKRMIESLPPARLKVAASFLAFLGTTSGEEAEPQLAAIARMRRRIRTAERDVAAGRSIDWRKIRSDV